MDRICVGTVLGAMLGGSLSQILAVDGGDASPLDAYGTPCPDLKADRNVRALFESLHAQGLLDPADVDDVAELLDATSTLLMMSRLSVEKPTDRKGNPVLHMYQIKADACLRTVRRQLHRLRTCVPSAHGAFFDEAANEIRQVTEDKVHNINLRPLTFR